MIMFYQSRAKLEPIKPMPPVMSTFEPANKLALSFTI